MANRNTSFSIPEKDYEDLKKLAEKNSRNVSNQLLALIREAVAKERKSK